MFPKSINMMLSQTKSYRCFCVTGRLSREEARPGSSYCLGRCVDSPCTFTGKTHTWQ